jgi:uncharacterized protein (TIGR03437 family)
MRILSAAVCACLGAHLLSAASNNLVGPEALRFEENQGQAEKSIRFLSRGQHHLLTLAPGEVALSLRSKSAAATLRMRLAGVNAAAQVGGVEPIAATSNYFLGTAPDKWRTGIRNYARVEYKNVYDGIDLIYYGSDQKLEYDFVVAPGSDPSEIRLRFSGARKQRIDSSGDLVLTLGAFEIRQRKPRIYQTNARGRIEIAGGYRMAARGEITFQIGDYDKAKPLIIDPVVTFSTYLGGTSVDIVNSLQVDAENNIYVAGTTISADFLTTAGSYRETSSGSADSFVTKFSPAGTVIYSTYVGGVGDDVTTALSLDSAGNAIVVGYTRSQNFPTVGAIQPVNKAVLGSNDGFIYKLNSAGSGLIFSTYYGGSNDDFLFGVTTDLTGNIYTAGLTNSTDFPVSVNAFQKTLKGSSNLTVTKLNSVGSSAAYSTYVGGTGNDSAASIVVDTAGNAYVTGATTSPDFPITAGAFQSIQKASTTSPFDAFALKLNPTGQALVYSTFLNGTGDERGTALAVDISGNLYIAGRTTSANFPTTPGSFQTVYSSTQDGFVTKLNPTGTAPIYSTFVGGNGLDVIASMKLDNAGQVYFGGATTSRDFPMVSPVQPVPGGGVDGFFGQLNAAGSALLLSTYFGGRGTDEINAIAVDSAGSIIIGGDTSSRDLAALSNSNQRNFGGGALDGFLFKYDFSVPRASLTISPAKLDFAGVVSGVASTQTFAITADNPSAVWTIDVSSAGWLSASPANGSGSATITVAANPGSLAIGTYSGTVTVVTRATGARTSLPVTLTLTNQGGGLVPPDAVVNAASFLQGPVSPGEIITVFGSNIGPEQLTGLQLTASGSVSTTLADVRVFFDGVLSPLIYVSAGQLSAIVPYKVAFKTTTLMQVEYKGIRSNPTALAVTTSSPAIFTANSSGSGPGAILNQDSSLNTAENPADKNSVVVLYVTGEGETNPGGIDGRPALDSYPKPRLPVTVKIGGVNAQVAYAAAAPGLVAGVMQVNVKVPDTIESGPTVPVSVTVGTNTSRSGVTLAVR